MKMTNLINETIADLLAERKRVVIPGLGAFLRKDGDGGVVFVEFLKKDDGALSGMLEKMYGLSSAESREALGGYIEVIKRDAARETGFVMLGLGVVRVDAAGVYDLQYNPLQKAETSSSPLSSSHAMARASIGKTVAERPAAPQPVTAPQSVTAQQPRVSAIPAPVQPKAAPAPEVKTEQTKQNNPAPRPAMPSPSQQQEIYKGRNMQYQKPAKQHPASGKKRADLIMIIAIVSAVIAMGVMVYGIMNEKPTDIIINTPTEQTQPE